MPVRFSNDSPAFRKDIESLYEAVKGSSAVSERLGRACCRDAQAALKRAEAGIGLASELQAAAHHHHAANAAPNGPPAEEHLGAMLAEVGSAMRALYDWQREAAAAVEGRVMQTIHVRADEEARRCKEARSRFVSSDDTWASSLARSHAVRLENNGGVQRADKDFVSTKLAFETSRFELCAALNESEAAKALALMELVTARVSEQLEFFEQGAAQLRELKLLVDGWAPAIEAQREYLEAERERNQATRTHLQQLTENSSAAPVAIPGAVGEEKREEVSSSSSRPPHREGYLFKKSARLGGQFSGRLGGQVSKQQPATGWKRLWFKLENGQLYYYKQAKSNIKVPHSAGLGAPGELTERVINLLICTVQPRERETGKRFCFDVISPYRTYTLQAESEAARTAWVEAIRAAVEHSIFCLDSSSHHMVAGRSGSANEIRPATGDNDGVGRNALAVQSPLSGEVRAARSDSTICADCGDSNTPPTWAVMPYGVLCCIECSGIHRSLGTHISKVRSIILDSWTQEMAALLTALGGSNVLLLACAPDGGHVAPGPSSRRVERERWIRSKYEARTYVARDLAAGPAELCQAAAAGEPLRLLRLLLANDSAINLRADTDSDELGPIHAAAAADAHLCCELLILSGASLELRSGNGRTALHLAAAAGAERCMGQLLRRGADANATDSEGHTPLDLARQNSHAGCEAALEEHKRIQSPGIDITIEGDDASFVPVISSKHLTPGRKVRGFIGAKLNLNGRRASSSAPTSTPSSPADPNSIQPSIVEVTDVRKRTSSEEAPSSHECNTTSSQACCGDTGADVHRRASSEGPPSIPECNAMSSQACCAKPRADVLRQALSEGSSSAVDRNTVVQHASCASATTDAHTLVASEISPSATHCNAIVSQAPNTAASADVHGLSSSAEQLRGPDHTAPSQSSIENAAFTAHPLRLSEGQPPRLDCRVIESPASNEDVTIAENRLASSEGQPLRSGHNIVSLQASSVSTPFIVGQRGVGQAQPPSPGRSAKFVHVSSDGEAATFVNRRASARGHPQGHVIARIAAIEGHTAPVS